MLGVGGSRTVVGLLLLASSAVSSVAGADYLSGFATEYGGKAVRLGCNDPLYKLLVHVTVSVKASRCREFVMGMAT